MCTGWCSGRLTMYVASVCHIWPYDCVVSLASGVCMVEFLPLMFLIEAQPWQSHLDRDVFLSMSKQGLRRLSVGQFGEALVSCDGFHGVLSALDVCSFSTHCTQWGVPGLLVQLKCTLYSWRAGYTHSLQKAGCHAHWLFYFARLYFTDK